MQPVTDRRKRKLAKAERLSLLDPPDTDNPATPYQIVYSVSTTIGHTDVWLPCQSDAFQSVWAMTLYKQVRERKYKTLDEMRAEQTDAFKTGFWNNRKAREQANRERVYG